jgi:hypothetical protein
MGEEQVFPEFNFAAPHFRYYRNTAELAAQRSERSGKT